MPYSIMLMCRITQLVVDTHTRPMSAMIVQQRVVVKVGEQGETSTKARRADQMRRKVKIRTHNRKKRPAISTMRKPMFARPGMEKRHINHFKVLREDKYPPRAVNTEPR